MRSISDYYVTIFDCDGVIFDSNDLKIQAMREVITNEKAFDSANVEEALSYFRSNFGNSRITHVDYIVKHFAKSALVNEGLLKNTILANYSLKCVELYNDANFTPNVLEFIESLNSQKYVASGSDEQELRLVFEKRKVTHYFSGIYGSPRKKVDIVDSIVSIHGSDDTVVIGDSPSDFYSAKSCGVDFIYYSPYSNVKEAMYTLQSDYGFSELRRFG